MELDRAIARAGYAFVSDEVMRALLESHGPLSDWDLFARSWSDLDADRYRPGGDRRRRYAVFAFDRSGAIARQPHQPHLQQPEYNVLFGGVERWFSPMRDDVAGSRTMDAILRVCDELFRRCAPAGGPWHVEVHQFRIEARAGMPGEPTPEGIHRDGVDFVLVLLVDRQNIVSGTTTVYELNGHPLGSFTLSRPLEAAVLDDHRVAHGVTPVSPLDPSQPGFRDVLVVTFRMNEV